MAEVEKLLGELLETEDRSPRAAHELAVLVRTAESELKTKALTENAAAWKIRIDRTNPVFVLSANLISIRALAEAAFF